MDENNSVPQTENIIEQEDDIVIEKIPLNNNEYRIKKYKKIRALGRGGFARCYELFDEETTTTEPSYAQGNSMYVGKDGYDSSSKTFASDYQTSKAYILFDNLTEQENIWSYSYFGDYCYMEIINSNNVYGWFVLYKDGTVVKTSENLSADKISLEYRTSSWPSGLLIFVDDSNMNTNPYQYTAYFYRCTYTPGETITAYTIKESLLPEDLSTFAKILYIS